MARSSTIRRPIGSRSCAGQPRSWQPVDLNSGDEGGTTEGIFACQWAGDVLRAQNHAVGGDYVLGWSRVPTEAVGDRQSAPREHIAVAGQLSPRRRRDVSSR